MKAEFWHERWKHESARLPPGRSQRAARGALVDARRPGVDPSAAAFVPLCGKSLDMAWLHDQGHPGRRRRALGDRAAGTSSPSQGLEASHAPHPRDPSIETWTGSGYTLHCGDFFALDARRPRRRGGRLRPGLARRPATRRCVHALCGAPGGRILPAGAKHAPPHGRLRPERDVRPAPQRPATTEVEALFGGETSESSSAPTNGPSDAAARTSRRAA